jgi:mannose-6-phosphate isomerase-like protein (cupin superfamily)
MKLRMPGAGPVVAFALLFSVLWSLSHVNASAQAAFVATPVVEKKIAQLPAGPLYWRIENFPTLAQAQAAAGPASLATEASGKVWLFTLGSKGGSTSGGSRVTEVGPVPPITAPEYLLRLNRASGPPGAKTAMHSHPGSEMFYVLAGQVSVTTPSGVSRADAGQSMSGHDADTPMQVASTGTTDLDQFVLFVVDATRPFSSPAKM